MFCKGNRVADITCSIIIFLLIELKHRTLNCDTQLYNSLQLLMLQITEFQLHFITSLNFKQRPSLQQQWSVPKPLE